MMEKLNISKKKEEKFELGNTFDRVLLIKQCFQFSHYVSNKPPPPQPTNHSNQEKKKKKLTLKNRNIIISFEPPFTFCNRN